LTDSEIILASTQSIIAEAVIEAKDYLKLLDEFKITDEDTSALALELAQEVHEKHKEYDNARLELGRPYAEAKKAIDELFKPLLKTLFNAKNIAKNKVHAWTAAQEEAKRKAIEEGNFEKTELLAEADVKQEVTLTPCWAWEVSDFDAVPREYLCVDISAVKIAIKNAVDPSKLNIPGIKIYQDTSFRLPRKK